jgi:hypothetical protein
MNQTIAGLKAQLASLRVQQTSGEEETNPLLYILPVALAGVIVAFFIYRKKKAEE